MNSYCSLSITKNCKILSIYIKKPHENQVLFIRQMFFRNSVTILEILFFLISETVFYICYKTTILTRRISRPTKTYYGSA